MKNLKSITLTLMVLLMSVLQVNAQTKKQISDSKKQLSEILINQDLRKFIL